VLGSRRLARGGAGGGSRINSTARWPERLEQVATLLRAEGAAVVALQSDEYRTLFAAHLDPDLSWSALLGEDVLRRAALDRETFATALAAGRWDDTVAYALLAPIEGSGPGRGVLCALRHGQPFDAVEIAAAHAAASLLTMSFADAQAAAEAQRRAPAEAPPAERALRVLVVEDHPAMRIGIESVLARGGLEVTGTVATCGEAVRRLAETGCDVVLLDLRLPDASGHEAIARLHVAAPATPLVVFSIDLAPELVRAALRAGASGFVAKDASPERVVGALRAAATGLISLSADTARALVGPASPIERSAIEGRVFERRAPAARALEASENDAADAGSVNGMDHEATRHDGGPREPIAPDLLSARELELLRYVAEGYTNKEIARAMTLAEDTVKKGIQSLIAKLGATDRTHAVVLALRSHVIE
jgi:DNA-binding NarL/FixJ family response regulator